MKENRNLNPRTIKLPSTDRLLWIVLAAGLALRLIFLAVGSRWINPLSMDSQNYLRIANNLLAGKGFVLWHKPSSFVAPLYPFFLAAVRAAFGNSIVVVQLIQILLSTISIYLVYRLGRALVDEKVALLAALLFAIHPEIIALTSFLYTETLFIFLALLALLAVILALQKQSVRAYVLAGFALALVNLCRGTLMYWPFFLIGFLWISGRPQRALLSPLRLALMIAVMALGMSPWAYRNYKQFHAFIPVATGLGDVFWTGNYLPFDGEFRYEETQKKILEITGDVTFVERDRILIHETIREMRQHPLASAWLMVKKVFRFWLRVYNNVPSGHQRSTNWLIFLPLAAVHFLLLAAAATGVTLLRGRIPMMSVIYSVLLYYTLIHAVTLAVPRYRQPLIPLLCILAAVGVLYFLQHRVRLRFSGVS